MLETPQDQKENKGGPQEFFKEFPEKPTKNVVNGPTYPSQGSQNRWKASEKVRISCRKAHTEVARPEIGDKRIFRCQSPRVGDPKRQKEVLRSPPPKRGA